VTLSRGPAGQRATQDSATPAAKPRRRVTDVPHDDISWFAAHARLDPTGWAQAEELARAELTARRDGYVVKWVHPWVCEFLELDGEKLIVLSGNVMLDGTPDTDPGARLVEEKLAREAGVAVPCGRLVPVEAKYMGTGDGYLVEWSRHWVCQLFEPDGETLIERSDGWVLDGTPDTDPFARVLAAQLTLDAGV
jgi:hypothetical protein